MSSKPQLHVSDDPAEPVAELLAAQARIGGAIVLTGGSSVGHAYTRAAALEPNWRKVSLWWSDERCVRPSDPLSNYGLAAATLLDRLAGLPQIHRMRGELPPAEAAATYDGELEGVELDLLLLGLGSDAHIASLFAGSPQLLEREQRATSGPAGLEPFVDRVTMTLPTLLGARRIVFLITGADKADAVTRAFAAEIADDAPASLLRTGSAPIDVYLDTDAASTLP
jgi:6-phosphogluconolactonase